MTEFTSAAQRVWTVFYLVHAPDGRVFRIEKSDDGCTRTVVVR